VVSQKAGLVPRLFFSPNCYNRDMSIQKQAGFKDMASLIGDMLASKAKRTAATPAAGISNLFSGTSSPAVQQAVKSEDLRKLLLAGGKQTGENDAVLTSLDTLMKSFRKKRMDSPIFEKFTGNPRSTAQSILDVAHDLPDETKVLLDRILKKESDITKRLGNYAPMLAGGAGGLGAGLLLGRRQNSDL